MSVDTEHSEVVLSIPLSPIRQTEVERLNAHARHLLAEFRGCNTDALDDLALIEKLMNQAARAARCTVVQSTFHAFAPQGVSGIVVIAESHLSIHTWPELGYAAVDFYTCGDDAMPNRAAEFLSNALDADEVELLTVLRGQRSGAPSMSIHAHTVERTDGAEPPSDPDAKAPDAGSP